ncbi:MAG: hypothetical protein HY879_05045 [Deltaproteobacteria bacterium]|nr:hypothetical protein [Deltaproteobacteria bacterium]
MRAKMVRSLRRVFRAEGVVFFLGDREFKTIDNADLVGAGMNLHYLDRWVRCYSRSDPFQQEAHFRSTVCKVDDILPYKRWVNLPIYNEFYRPQNIHYKLSISLRSNARVLGLIGLFRPKDQADFSRRDVAKARILAPHLTTALENSIQFTEMDESKKWFGGWGDKLPSFGIIILNYDLRPVYWNSSADAFCGMLCPEQAPHPDAINLGGVSIPPEIVRDCLSLKGLFQNGLESAALRRQRIMESGPNRKFQINASLVEHALGERSALRFVIYMLDFSETGPGREEVLKEKYQLTRREIAIAHCVSQGLTNDEIGERLYISRFTVETHLKNIFDKTKVKNRTSLAGLLQSV